MHPHSALVLDLRVMTASGLQHGPPNNNNNNNNTNDSKHCHQLAWSRQRPFDLEISKHVASMIQQLVSLSPFYRRENEAQDVDLEASHADIVTRDM